MLLLYMLGASTAVWGHFAHVNHSTIMPVMPHHHHLLQQAAGEARLKQSSILINN